MLPDLFITVSPRVLGWSPSAFKMYQVNGQENCKGLAWEEKYTGCSRQVGEMTLG